MDDRDSSGGVSMRVRVGRNLSAFPLPGAMDQGQRCEMENLALTGECASSAMSVSDLFWVHSLSILGAHVGS